MLWNKLLITPSGGGGNHWMSEVTSDIPGHVFGGIAVDVDASGNVYSGGYFWNGSTYAGMINKQTSAGAIVWTRQITGLSNSPYGVNELKLDASGNVFVLVTTAAYGFGLLKFNSSGTLLWQRQLDAAGTEIGNGITVDSSGNVYICGATTSEGAGSYDLIIAKYDTYGNILWQRVFGGANIEYGFPAVVTDTSNNVYVCGYTTSQGAGGYDMLLIKYDTDGNLLWQRAYGTTQYEYANCVRVGPSGNVYICGKFVVGSTYDAVLAKINPSGTLLWRRSLGGIDNWGGDHGSKISIDSSENIYMCGRNDQVNSGVNLLAKYDLNGNLIWQRYMTQYIGNDTQTGIVVDAASNFYVASYASYGMLIAKLPTDGSKVGSYNISVPSFGGTDTILYQPSTLSSTTPELTTTVTTLTSSVSTLASSGGSLGVSAVATSAYVTNI